MMLSRLYKKLHILFVSSIMLIITLVLATVCVNNIHLEKVNESTLFQRISTLLIYQLEDNTENYSVIIKEYEDQYNIFCTLKDSTGNILYQAQSSFTTSADLLLEDFQKQTTMNESIPNQNKTSTLQGGLFEIKGNSNDKYWGIPVTLITKDENTYQLALIYKQKNTLEIISTHLPFYFLIEIVSCVGVIVISHLILKKALEPTERILKSQKEFVATASHELKSPLAVILANVEKINNLNIINTQIKQSVKIMDKECIRMSKLIKEMLFLASSDAKTWTLTKENVEIDTLLINLYSAYEPLCMNKQIQLDLQLLDTSYPILYTDKERIFQILSIYIDNAIYHSIDNSSIEIKTTLTNKELTFYIIDHGQGIKQVDKPFIFNRFYCSDHSHTDKSHFGLGLSIAKELAIMLNGKVGFQDTHQHGATFYLTIPLK